MINHICRMTFLFVFLFLSLPGHSYGANETEIKTLMGDYLYALNQKDANALKSLCSKNYIDLLNRDNTLKKVFAMQTSVKKSEIKFDLKIQKAVRTKDQYFVNIKNKSDKDYDEYWFVVKKEQAKFRIIDMIAFDD